MASNINNLTDYINKRRENAGSTPTQQNNSVTNNNYTSASTANTPSSGNSLTDYITARRNGGGSLSLSSPLAQRATANYSAANLIGQYVNTVRQAMAYGNYDPSNYEKQYNQLRSYLKDYRHTFDDDTYNSLLNNLTSTRNMANPKLETPAWMQNKQTGKFAPSTNPLMSSNALSQDAMKKATDKEDIKKQAYYIGIGGDLGNYSTQELANLQKYIQKQNETWKNKLNESIAKSYTAPVGTDDQARSEFLQKRVPELVSQGMSDAQALEQAGNEFLKGGVANQVNSNPLMSYDLWDKSNAAIDKELNTRRALVPYAQYYSSDTWNEDSKYDKSLGYNAYHDKRDGDRATTMPDLNEMTDDQKARLFYDSLNGNKEATRMLTYARNTFGDDIFVDPNIQQYMTQDERSMFNYLYKNDPEQAMQYFDVIKESLNKRNAAAYNEELKQYLEENPASALTYSAVSVLTKPFAAGSRLINEVVDMIKNPGHQIDEWDAKYLYGNTPDLLRGAVSNKITNDLGSEGWGLAYQGIMSALDNVYGMSIGGGLTKAFGLTGDIANKATELITLGIMGTDAATSTVINNMQSGMSQTDALVYGFSAGAIEVLTEKIGIDNMMNSIWKGKSAWVSWAKQVLSEGTEEAMSDVMNDVFGRVYDSLTGRDSSEWNREINQYILENGLAPNDREKAFSAVFADHMKQMGIDFALGGFSAMGLGGFGTYQEIRNTRANGANAINALASNGITADSTENLRALAEDVAGNKAADGTKSQKLAQRIIDRTGQFSVTDVKQSDVNNLVYSMLSDGLIDENGNAIDSVTNRFINGESPEITNKPSRAETALGREFYNAAITDAVRNGSTQAEAEQTVKDIFDAGVAQAVKNVNGVDPRTLFESVKTIEDVRNELRSTPVWQQARDNIANPMNTSSINPAIANAVYNSGIGTQMVKENTVQDNKKSYTGKTATIYDQAINEAREKGIDVEKATAAFDEIYNAAYTNKNNTNNMFSNEITNKIMSQAIMDSDNEVNLLVKRGFASATPSINYAGNGSTFDRPTSDTGIVANITLASQLSNRNISQTTIDNMNRVIKALGLRVMFTDSDAKYNGSYDNDTGTITLAFDSVFKAKGSELDAVLYATFGHEVTHRLQRMSPTAYNALASAVSEAMGNEFNKAVAHEIRRSNGQMSKPKAMDEVIADFVGTHFFSDSTFTDKLFDEITKDLEPTEKVSILQRFKDWISKAIQALKGSKNPDDLKTVDRLEKVEKALTELFNESKSVNTARTESEAVTKIEFDSETESYNPQSVNAQYSYRTWNESDYVKSREVAARDMAENLGISVSRAKKYIDTVNSVAKMIADDATRLDYVESNGYSAFVGNVEYGGSFDFTTMCRKARLFMGTFSKVQQQLGNQALSADEVLELRKMMKDKGYEVTCGCCYVEGSRANEGKFATKFMELYGAYYPEAWQPSLPDLITPDGIEWTRINHPDCFELYNKFWNDHGKLRPDDPNLFASQQKPKMYQARTPYRSEIMDKFKNADSIEQKNTNGGIRMQSFSDFEIVHLIDCMQAVMDMSRVGLASQAYTKVYDFAAALGNTNMKINLSLMAKGVNEDGTVMLDEVEGMKRTEAEKLRNMYPKNVGTIIVAFNDAQVLAAMNDPFIDYIIPFHRSQWKKSQYAVLGLPAKVKDYTNQQNEKLIKQTYHEFTNKNGTRLVKDKATNFMPNEYWEFDKSGKENAEKYLRLCAANNKRPKFYKFLQNNGDGSYSLKADGSTDGYWKVLIDFKMYDNDGVGSPQLPLVPDFNMTEINRMLTTYDGGHAAFPVANNVVDEFVATHKKTSSNDVVHSTRDTNEDEIRDDMRKEHDSDADKYSYDFMVNKPDMNITNIPTIAYLEPTKSNKNKIVADALKNASLVGRVNEKGNVFVQVDDTGEEVQLSTHGLKHGFDRRFNDLIPVTLKSGEILKNSIKINELKPKKDNVDASFVYMGAAKDEDNNINIVEFVVNGYSKELESLNVLYSINTKKELAAILPSNAAKDTVAITNSTLSIAQLLDLASKYFPDVLPESVYKHFGFTERPAGKLGESAIYSTRDDNPINYETALALAEQEDEIRRHIDNSRWVADTSGWRSLVTKLDTRKLRRGTEVLINEITPGLTKEQTDKYVNKVNALARDIIEKNTPYAEIKDKSYKIASDIIFSGTDAEIRKGMQYSVQAEQAVDYLSNALLANIITTNTNEAAKVTKKLETQISKNERLKDTLKEVRTKRDAEIQRRIDARKAEIERHHESQERTRLLNIMKRLERAKTTEGWKNQIHDLIGEFDLTSKSLTSGVAQNLTELGAWIADHPDLEIQQSTKDAFLRLGKRHIDGQTTEVASYKSKEEAEAALKAYKENLPEGSEVVAKIVQRGKVGDGTREYVLTAVEGMMSIDEVRNLTQALLNIEKAIQNQNHLVNSEDRRDTHTIGMQIIEGVENSRRGKNGSITGVKYVKSIDGALTEMLRPETEFLRLVGFDKSNPMYQLTFGNGMSLATGQRSMIDYQRRANDNYFGKFLNDKDFAKIVNGKHARAMEIKGRDENGRTVTLKVTPGLMMSIYMHMQNEQNMKHIADTVERRKTKDGEWITIEHKAGGMTIPDFELFRQGKVQEAYRAGIKITSTRAEMVSATSKLTEKERAFIRAAQRYYSEMSQPEINKVSSALNGYELAKVDNYFRINTDSAYRQVAFDTLKFDGTIEGMGWTKERQNASNPIILIDMIEQLQRDIDGHSKYVGLAIPVRNFNKALGVTANTYTEDGKVDVAYATGVMRTIDRVWSSNATNYIAKLMTDIQSPGTAKDFWGSALSKVRSNYAKAVLSVNAGVAIKQAASLPTAAAEIGWAPLIKAIGPAGSRIAWGKMNMDIVNKYSPLMRLRTEGISNQELGDIKKEGREIPKLLNWIQGMDVATVKKLWKASEYYVRANFKELSINTEAYYKKVGEIHSKVIEKTQPNYSALQRPQLLRTNNELVKTLNMFKTQPFQNLNILIEATAELKSAIRADKINPSQANALAKKQALKRFSWAISSQLISSLVFAAMQAGWDFLRKKDDKYKDENGEYTLASIFSILAINMGSNAFGMVPFGSAIFEAVETVTDNIAESVGAEKIFDARYYGIDAGSATDSINDMFKGVISIISDSVKLATDIKKQQEEGTEVDWEAYGRKAWSDVKSMLMYKGIPVENAETVASSAAKWLMHAVDGGVVGEFEVTNITEGINSKNKGKYVEELVRLKDDDPAQYQNLYNVMVDSKRYGKDTEESVANIDEAMKKKYLGTLKTKDDIKYIKNTFGVDISGNSQNNTYAVILMDENKTSTIRDMVEMGFSTDEINDGLQTAYGMLLTGTDAKDYSNSILYDYLYDQRMNNIDYFNRLKKQMTNLGFDFEKVNNGIKESFGRSVTGLSKDEYSTEALYDYLLGIYNTEQYKTTYNFMMEFGYSADTISTGIKKAYGMDLTGIDSDDYSTDALFDYIYDNNLYSSKKAELTKYGFTASNIASGMKDAYGRAITGKLAEDYDTNDLWKSMAKQSSTAMSSSINKLKSYGVSEDTIKDGMRKAWVAEKTGVNIDDAKVGDIYSYMYDEYKKGGSGWLSTYQKAIDVGYTAKAIKEGIESLMKVEYGVDNVKKLPARFNPPEANDPSWWTGDSNNASESKQTTKVTDSSWIGGVSYDSNTAELTIIMNGAPHVFYNVPEEVYDEMIKSGSKGSYYNKHIKGRY